MAGLFQKISGIVSPQRANLRASQEYIFRSNAPANVIIDISRAMENDRKSYNYSVSLVTKGVSDDEVSEIDICTFRDDSDEYHTKYTAIRADGSIECEIEEKELEGYIAEHGGISPIASMAQARNILMARLESIPMNEGLPSDQTISIGKETFDAFICGAVPSDTAFNMNLLTMAGNTAPESMHYHLSNGTLSPELSNGGKVRVVNYTTPSGKIIPNAWQMCDISLAKSGAIVVDRYDTQGKKQRDGVNADNPTATHMHIVLDENFIGYGDYDLDKLIERLNEALFQLVESAEPELSFNIALSIFGGNQTFRAVKKDPKRDPELFKKYNSDVINVKIPYTGTDGTSSYVAYELAYADVMYRHNQKVKELLSRMNEISKTDLAMELEKEDDTFNKEKDVLFEAKRNALKEISSSDSYRELFVYKIDIIPQMDDTPVASFDIFLDPNDPVARKAAVTAATLIKPLSNIANKYTAFSRSDATPEMKNALKAAISIANYATDINNNSNEISFIGSYDTYRILEENIGNTCSLKINSSDEYNTSIRVNKRKKEFYYTDPDENTVSVNDERVAMALAKHTTLSITFGNEHRSFASIIKEKFLGKSFSEVFGKFNNSLKNPVERENALSAAEFITSDTKYLLKEVINFMDNASRDVRNATRDTVLNSVKALKENVVTELGNMYSEKIASMEAQKKDCELMPVGKEKDDAIAACEDKLVSLYSERESVLGNPAAPSDLIANAAAKYGLIDTNTRMRLIAAGKGDYSFETVTQIAYLSQNLEKTMEGLHDKLSDLAVRVGQNIALCAKSNDKKVELIIPKDSSKSSVIAKYELGESGEYKLAAPPVLAGGKDFSEALLIMLTPQLAINNSRENRELSKGLELPDVSVKSKSKDNLEDIESVLETIKSEHTPRPSHSHSRIDNTKEK